MLNKFLKLILKKDRTLLEQNEYLKLLVECSVEDYKWLTQYEREMSKDVELRDEALRLSQNFN